MRPTKFRAWDKVRNEYFTEGNLHLDRFGNLWLDKVFDNPVNDRFVIEWFTGHLDKNGKEIYEGDIVRTAGYEKSNKQEVVFGYYCCDTGIDARNSKYDLSFSFYGWHLKFIGQKPRYCSGNTEALGEDGSCFEIVGNIHDNPKLLEGEND